MEGQCGEANVGHDQTPKEGQCGAQHKTMKKDNAGA